MNAIEYQHVSMAFGEKTVIQDFNLAVKEGEFVTIIGSSGCGKTTILKMVNGLVRPTDGVILVNGVRTRETDLTQLRRSIGYAIQGSVLFPHMTVLQNVVYGLKFRGVKREQARQKGMRYLEMVGLGDYASAYIQEISRGQQQRVALARALIVEPKLCLLDEPFCNLDAALRTRMRYELKRLQKDLGLTMVFVTHDQEEAIILADRIAIMDQGELVQNDAPLDLCRKPASPFVAEFMDLESLVWTEDGRLLKIIKR